MGSGTTAISCSKLNRNFIGVEREEEYFDICNETKDYISMWLMSQCWGGAITANSTFSWWGAYFARQNAPKPFTAFFPNVWGQGLPPAKDVVPDWGTSVHINL